MCLIRINNKKIVQKTPRTPKRKSLARKRGRKRIRRGSNNRRRKTKSKVYPLIALRGKSKSSHVPTTMTRKRNSISAKPSS